MSIRVGDYQRGYKIATGPTSTKELMSECAELLENVKVSISTLFLAILNA